MQLPDLGLRPDPDPLDFLLNQLQCKSTADTRENDEANGIYHMHHLMSIHHVLSALHS